MSSLASKCVFNRPEHKANGAPLKWNFEVLGMQRWDKPTDRAQRVNEKNVVKMLVCKIHNFRCQRWQFQACYGSTNKKFMLCLADFGH